MLRLELEERETRIEEKTEFLNPDLEKFGKEKMTCLVQQDKYGKAQKQLCGLDEKYFHRSLSVL